MKETANIWEDKVDILGVCENVDYVLANAWTIVISQCS